MVTELQKLVNEICTTAEWLDLRQKLNCLVFMYGPPLHGTENAKHLQKEFEKVLEETRQFSIIYHQMVGKIKMIQKLAEKHLTISNSNIFDSINVS
jgi:hypothetical protein